MNTNGWVLKLSWNSITVLSSNFSSNMIFVNVPNEIKICINIKNFTHTLNYMFYLVIKGKYHSIKEWYTARKMFHVSEFSFMNEVNNTH